MACAGDDREQHRERLDDRLPRRARQLRPAGAQGRRASDPRQLAAEEVNDFDRAKGTMVQTGNLLDVAVTGDAWIAVQATDGTEAYTRRGDLRIAPSGVLETGDGFPVMGSGGPITVPPADKVIDRRGRHAYRSCPGRRPEPAACR